MAADYGKPGMNTSDPAVRHHLAAPAVARAFVRGGSLLIEVAFASELHTDYGAPATAWINYTAGPAAEHTLHTEVHLLNKTATRLPEAMFVSFDPPQPKPLRWSMQKLGSWLHPNETLDGGAKGLHAVSDAGLRCTAGGDRLTVGSLDAALLRWGAPTPFPNPCLGPVDTAGGASYVLFNNMYNTNYVFWWPFDADHAVHASIKYRFSIRLEQN
jgi:hypothetical protein